MELTDISGRGIVLLGCGKMGGALLEGWLAGGLPPAAFTIIEPHPSPRLQALAKQGLRLNEELPTAPDAVILAIKPQMMGDALPSVAALGDSGTLFLSIAAGTEIAGIAKALGERTPIVRAMPNTPAAVGRGVTALVANEHVSRDQFRLADSLMQAVGQTVHLDSEDQMDAVTAVSGSGPAYVFHLIEALAQAGEAEGLSPDLALKLARATVGGAGQLAEDADETPEQLRINVTSPAGTTAAALDRLMNPDDGLSGLMREAVAAAAKRSRELRG